MAIGDPYARPEHLEVRLNKSDDGSFERLLASASRAVEGFTRRQFNRADEEYPSARRFRSLDPERVPVDDFHTLEELEVEVNGVPWDVDLYIDARPWNGTSDGVIAWPYSDLFAVNRSWPWSRRALVTVAAHWGWESVPAGIVQATLSVAEVLSLGSSVSGPVRSETIGGYAISYGTPVRADDVPTELVEALPFRRQRFGIA